MDNKQISGCQGLWSGGIRYKEVLGSDGQLCILTVVVVTQIHACVKTHTPVYHHHYQKPILLYANIKI